MFHLSVLGRKCAAPLESIWERERLAASALRIEPPGHGEAAVYFVYVVGHPSTATLRRL